MENNNNSTTNSVNNNKDNNMHKNHEYFKILGEEMLHSKKVKGKLLFFCQVGSHSFNLNVETSDNDYFGVYELDSDQLLSLNQSPHSAFIDGHDPEDFVMYELSKFCDLLLKGNPKLVEPLFTERNCYISSKWEQLRTIRHRFISQLVIGHYVSYSKSQLGDAKKAQTEKSGNKQTVPFTPSKGSTEERKEKGNDGLSNNHSPSKKMYHTIRLLHEAMRMLDGGDPLVYLEGEHREYIMSIRMGKISVQDTMDQVNKLYEEVYAKIDKMKSDNPNNIPLVGDKDALNQWIINCRRQTLDSYKKDTPGVEYYSSKDFKLINPNKTFENVIEKCNEIMSNNNIKDYHLLYIGRSGSTLHGTKQQDQDWIAVYVTKTDTIFSLYQPVERLDDNTSATTANNGSGDSSPTQQTAARDTYVNGIQIFEVTYFLYLLSQGNHRAVEQFYNERDDYCSSLVWDDLRSSKINYLTGNFIHHCFGVAQGAISKSKALLSSDNNNQHVNTTRKHIYHATKLLFYAESVFNSNNLNSKFNHHEQKLLLSILNYGDDNDVNDLTATEQLIQECINQSNAVSLKMTKLGGTTKEKKTQEQNVKNYLNPWIIKVRLSL